MSEALIGSAVAGAIGGVCRGTLGFVNAVKTSKKGEPFDWQKYAVTLVEGTILGGVAGYLFPDANAAFWAGFGGTYALKDVKGLLAKKA